MSDDAGAVELALQLLGRMAEDALVPPSYRVAARRHLKRLAKAAAPPKPDDWDQA